MMGHLQVFPSLCFLLDFWELFNNCLEAATSVKESAKPVAPPGLLPFKMHATVLCLRLFIKEKADLHKHHLAFICH